MAQGNLSGSAGRALVLVGFMGSGKSSAARALADGALDSDTLVERDTGLTVQRIFERDGESCFREIEERVVLDGLRRAAAGEGGGVISLGGGALASQNVRDALKSHTVVLLDLDAEGCWQRVKGSARPLASDWQAFEALFEARRSAYSAAADAIVPSDGLKVIREALPSVAKLAAAPRETRMVWANADSGSYPVFVGRGVLSHADLRPQRRSVLITDSTVASLHCGSFADVLARIAIEPGEKAKNLATIGQVWSQLAAAGTTRDDQVIAVGGGVVGDLAGFAAAAYQRGIPVTHVPTTLVAQVDSSLGGKTGVDIPEGKNYIGAYHQPDAVITDVDTLETLPPEERAAGMAEVIKTALIAGGPLWQQVARSATVGVDEIVECVRLKLSVVAADERDGGRRQVLNLGHTIGHAIETATSYARLRHGEAVSIGLMAALRLSGAEELRSQVGELLAEAGLPLQIGGVDPQTVIDLISADKKARSDGTIPFVFCDRPGNATHGNEVSPTDLRFAVEEVCG